MDKPDPSKPIPNADPRCGCMMTSRGTAFSLSISPGCFHHGGLIEWLERGIIGNVSTGPPGRETSAEGP